MANIAIIGATGAVGRKILEILEERKFPVETLRLLASEKSKGTTLSFKSESIHVGSLHASSFNGIDLAFFCAGSEISKTWIPKTTCQVIDSSSYFRSKAPLIIPEINGHLLETHPRIASSPNCAATIFLMPLFRLHHRFRIKRAILSTYQAASGGGAVLLNQLLKETNDYFSSTNTTQLLGFPYAFNLYPHNSPLKESGYVEEEIKIADEVKLILNDPTIKLSATSIRVPVLYAHAISANVEFHHPFTLQQALEEVNQTPGVRLFEDRSQNRFATPADATGMDEVLCGRFRIDPTQPHTLEFWSVGDQLRKGAALNAVQIAELMTSLERKGRGFQKRGALG
jgi:aspartate-semialdehyde dehydrogenase